jgi:benzoylformate decarboxylase
VIPEQETVDHIAGLLAAAVCPIAIIGDGVAASGAQAELTRVAELVEAEVWGADSSEVNMGPRHPQFQGLLGYMFGEQSRAVTQRADVAPICGTYVFPEVFLALSCVFAPGARVIHIDLDPSQIANNFPVDVGVVADPKVTLARTAEGLDRVLTVAQKRTATTRIQAMAAAKERQQTAERAVDLETADAVPMQPARFMAELSRKLPPDAIVFDEALTCSPARSAISPSESSQPLSISTTHSSNSMQWRADSASTRFVSKLPLRLARLSTRHLPTTGRS